MHSCMSVYCPDDEKQSLQCIELLQDCKYSVQFDLGNLIGPEHVFEDVVAQGGSNSAGPTFGEPAALCTNAHKYSRQYGFQASLGFHKGKSKTSHESVKAKVSRNICGPACACASAKNCLCHRRAALKSTHNILSAITPEKREHGENA